MEVVHNFGKTLFGLVLTGHIGEFDALGGLYIYLGIALSHAEGHGVLAAHLLHHFLGHIISQQSKDDQRQDESQQETPDGGDGFFDNPGKLRTGVVEPLGKIRVLHGCCFVDGESFFVRKQNLRILHLHGADLLLLCHFHEGSVIHLCHLPPGKQRCYQQIEQENNQQYDTVIINQWLFG